MWQYAIEIQVRPPKRDTKLTCDWHQHAAPNVCELVIAYKVAKDCRSARADSQVGEAAEKPSDAEAVIWAAPLVDLGEEARCVPLFGKSIERSRSDVKIAVCGGKREDQDSRIDNAGKGLDAELLNGHNEGRGSSRSAGLVGDEQFGIIRSDEQGDAEDTCGAATSTPTLPTKGQRAELTSNVED